MVQGGSGCRKDIPPYVMCGRHPVAYMGINLVRLRREGYSKELIDAIHNAYRMIYQSGMNVSMAIAALKESPLIEFPEVKYIVDFTQSSERGIIRD
jgi:UDP-N-acetylglucosamine acyltransferase